MKHFLYQHLLIFFEIMESLDEPFMMPRSSTYLLSKFTKQHVSVALEMLEWYLQAMILLAVTGQKNIK